MNPTAIRRWLRLIGVAKFGDEGSDWLNCCCPLAEWEHQSGTDRTPSFGVKIEPGDSQVYCFSCTFGGQQSDVLMQLEAHSVEINYAEAWDAIWEAESTAELSVDGEGYEEDVHGPKTPEHIYPEFLLTETTEPAYAEDQVHPYLARRGVTFEVAERWDIRLDPYRRRIVTPVRDFDGRLRGLHGRHLGGDYAIDDVHSKYKMYPHAGQTNPHVWLGEHLIDLERPILMPESKFDLFKCNQLYDNVITPLTASLSREKVARLMSAVEIVTFFDGDDAGERARSRLREWLPDTEVRHIKPEAGFDADETDLDLIWEYLKEVDLVT